MTSVSPNRVHEHFDGIGATCVDEIIPREVEKDRPLTSEQVGNTVNRPSRCCGERPAECRDASLRLAMEVHHKRFDRRVDHWGRGSQRLIPSTLRRT
jgi:hypothetical protein